METFKDKYIRYTEAMLNQDKLNQLKICWELISELKRLYSNNSTVGVASEIVRNKILIKYSEYTKYTNVEDAIEKVILLETELDGIVGSSSRRYLSKIIYDLICGIYNDLDIQLSLLSIS